MCTVTYLPIEKNHFILTSNRDESPLRANVEVESEVINGKKLILPRDKAGGTWITAADSNQVVCLLNGAYEKHHRNPPYRKSRGLMVLDFFEFKNSGDFFDQYEFNRMEPFTMIIYDDGSLYEFRWDEKEKHIKALNTKETHLWSSSTLYSAAIRAKRQQWFSEWLAGDPEFSKENIIHLHQTGGKGDEENGYIMNRNNIVRTVSITSIEKKKSRAELSFIDLIHEKDGSWGVSLES